jgi:hypothetical protein
MNETQKNSSTSSFPSLASVKARTRREFLWHFGGGLGGIAIAQLLGAQGLLADTLNPKPEFNGGLHHRAKAKRVVQLFSAIRLITNPS